MKKGLIPVLLLLAVFSTPRTLLAESPSSDSTAVHVSVGLQSWLSRADARWQISFPYVTTVNNSGIPAGTPGKAESRLDFNKIDSTMIILTGGIGVGPYFSFDGSFGKGSIGSGHGTDTDRFIPDSGGGLEFSQSTNDIDGDVIMGEINFYYNNHQYTGKHLGPWGFVFGYTHYEDKLRLTNGVQTVSIPFEGLIFPPPGPFSMLNSTFDFYWDAIKIGVLPQFDITDKLSVKGLFALYPFVSYRGEGYWNLRTAGPNAFRMQSPNYIQKSTSGYGLDALLGLTYAIGERLDLTAGYRYFYLYDKDGTDTTYFANGTTATSNLDWATITRQGAMIEVLFKF